jgi:class 3 adenylate cyclase/tetratricopeptide (TPR) repeat protein
LEHPTASFTTVLEWLDSLQLRRYAAAFENQAIDMSLLRSLSDDDLRHLGVKALGHRKRLMAAIGQLGDSATPEPRLASVDEQGELKFVSVLFFDIVGSTDLIQALDPEAAEDLLSPHVRAAALAIRANGGAVVRELGDGGLAVFGAPTACEDHAILACEAGLAIQQASGETASPSQRARPITLRVGIHSGDVVVRRAGERVDNIHGAAVHLAARMEQTCAPGTVRISHATARLVEGVFDLSTLGAVTVKGIDAPVDCYALGVRSSTVDALSRATRRTLSDHVDRIREAATLAESADRAARGEGRLVAITGGPGVGKSRLAHEFLASSGKCFRILRGHAEPHSGESQYEPFVPIVSEMLEERGDDPEADRARRLKTRILALSAGLGAAVGPLQALLGARADDADWDQLEPAARRRRTVDAICALLVAQSSRMPVAIVVEDLHWSDEGTRATLRALVKCLPGRALLILATYRPEFSPSWTENEACLRISLEPLEPDFSDQLLAGLLGTDASVAPLKSLLVHATGGNPLFLEESVRSLFDTGAVVSRDGYRLQRPVETIEIPASVQSIVSARVDSRSPRERSILQAASVVGMDIPLQLLSALLDDPLDELQQTMSELEAADFVHLVQRFPEWHYRFKHALTRDAVYRHLMKRSKRELHARFVTILEAQTPTQGEARFGLLAYHALNGDLGDKAVQYSMAYGDELARSHANEGAVAAYANALAALDMLPRSDDRERQRARVLLKTGTIHLLLGHLDESYDRFREARAVAEAGSDVRLVVAARNRIGSILGQRCDVYGAQALLNETLALARGHGDIAGQGNALHLLGSVHMAVGELDAARDYYLEARGIAESQGDLKGIAVESTLVCCVLVRLGEPALAKAAGLHALQSAKAANDERRIAWASLMLAEAENLLAEFASADEHLAHAREITTRHGDFRGVAWVLAWSGSGAVKRGDYRTGAEAFLKATDMAGRSTGNRSETCFVIARAAECLLHLGSVGEAWNLCNECLALAEPLGIRIEIGYARMVLAQLYAEEEYRDWSRALELIADARELLAAVGAQLDVGLADLGEARILRRQGRAVLAAQKAREALACFEKLGGVAYAEQARAFIASDRSELAAH